MNMYERALEIIREAEKCKPNNCCISVPGPTGPTGPAGGPTGPTGATGATDTYKSVSEYF